MDDIISRIWTVTFKSAIGSPLNGVKDLQTSNINSRFARGPAQGEMSPTNRLAVEDNIRKVRQVKT
jgi:hypothetical protein